MLYLRATADTEALPNNSSFRHDRLLLLTRPTTARIRNDHAALASPNYLQT